MSGYERYPVVLVHGIGVGVLKKFSAHHGIVELNDGKHKWDIAVTEEEFTVLDDITIGYEEIE